MKYQSIKTSTLLVAIGFCFISNILNAQLSKVEIVATGLTCSMCSNAIFKQLKSIDGVEKVEIDLNENRFIVFLKNQNALTPKTFKNKVESTGFFVGSMVLSINSINLSIEDGKQLDNYVFIDSKPKLINGLVLVKVLDKGYVTAKEFRKLTKAYNKYPSYLQTNESDFHVKLIE